MILARKERYTTKGVSQTVDLLLQLFMWSCVDNLSIPKDRLQVFKCTAYGTNQKIIHIQEEHKYKREYLIISDAPVFIGKVYIIDDETHETMLLVEEY